MSESVTSGATFVEGACAGVHGAPSILMIFGWHLQREAKLVGRAHGAG